MPRGRRHHAVAGAAAGLLVIASLVAGHPGCYDDEALQDDTPLVFCPVEDEGVCCTLEEEEQAMALYTPYAPIIQDVPDDQRETADACGEAWKQVSCGRCGSYAGHLYARLGGELGVDDGMTMKKDFCEKMVSDCAGLIDFAAMTYEGGMSYCEKHTEAEDEVWSHPIDPEEKSFSSEGLTDAFPNLPDDQLPEDLISMKMSPDGTEWWLVGQAGEIMTVSPDDPTSSDLILKIDKDDFFIRVAYEEGLLDVAFDPDYNNNKFFYCSYTIDDGSGYRNRLARFTKSGSASATAGTYEHILTSTDKATSIHSAGWVDFKPETRDLYWAIGDGGAQEDPDGTGSDLTNILASIVRITAPSSGTNFNLSPSGNMPGGNGAICASGFRNPFRCGFDRESPYDLYCGDVGHTFVEEIDKVVCGNDYGWSRFEGSRCQEEQNSRFMDKYGEDCDSDLSRDNLVFPMFEYCHRSYPSNPATSAYLTDGKDICGEGTIQGEAVIGGYRYRGKRFEEVLSGALIFADSQRKNIYYLTETSDDVWEVSELTNDAGASIISFAEDNEGEQYVVTRGRKPYLLPCGLLCGEPDDTDEGETSTCLDQGDTELPAPSYESEGCWSDDKDDRVLYLATPSCDEGERLMSPEICARYCSTVEGATYFGLEFARECFCGNDASATTGFKKLGSLEMDKCELLCTDASGATCGGINAIEVFEMGESTGPSPTPTFPDANAGAGYAPADKGCVVDNKNDRVLSIVAQMIPGEAMTTQICAGLCEGKGKFFGTEYSYECFCSDDSTDDYDRLGTDGALCNYACSGDSDQICGGEDAIQVYEYSGSSQPSPTPSPVTPASTDDYASLGCFADDREARVLSIEANMNENFPMTVEACAELCSGYGSEYFGLQYAYECFCSASGDTPSSIGPSTSCDAACTGNGNQICGGTDAFSAYEYGSATAPPSGDGYSEIGCYVDAAAPNRIMSINFPENLAEPNDLMTTEYCAGLCTGEGSEYFGTQYGYQCFCSASSDALDFVEGGAVCDESCSGDALQTCGGTYAMTVYKFDD